MKTQIPYKDPRQIEMFGTFVSLAPAPVLLEKPEEISITHLEKVPEQIEMFPWLVKNKSIDNARFLC